MSKSRYSPINYSSRWIRNHSHRTYRRHVSRWMHHVRRGKSDYEEYAEPSTKILAKIFWYWYW